MSPNYNEAVALLSTLWQPPGFGELRILGDKGALKPYWLGLPIRLDHLAVALDWAYKRNTEGYNVYFGVHPRSERRGRNEDVPQYHCLIADLDKPDISWPLYDQLAKECPASICVRTPRGMHLYWLLTDPEDSQGPARARMRLLQRAIKSDAVHDPARILRLPGAVCHKTDAGMSVYVAWIDSTLTYTSEFIAEKVLAVWPDAKSEPTSTDQKAMVSLYERPFTPDLVQRFSEEIPKGSRSEHCLAFIYTAVVHGWTMNQIHDALLSMPIGGHYIDRGRSGESSFEYDYEKTVRGVSYEIQSSLKVVIEQASIVINEDSSRKFRLRLKQFSHRAIANTGFNCWITIPDDQHQQATPRWQAFLAAINAVGYTEDQLLSNLPGRAMRITFHEDDQSTVARFLPAD